MKGTKNLYFEQFRSPVDERSMFKGIPMRLRDNPFVLGMMAVGCRVRYRGPRYGGTASPYHTLKRDATSFSIYPPSPRRERTRGPDMRWRSHTFWPWDRPSHRHLMHLEERLSEIRYAMDAAREVLEDSKRHEQEILTQMSRYNSVTKTY